MAFFEILCRFYYRTLSAVAVAVAAHRIAAKPLESPPQRSDARVTQSGVFGQTSGKSTIELSDSDYSSMPTESVKNKQDCLFYRDIDLLQDY